MGRHRAKGRYSQSLALLSQRIRSMKANTVVAWPDGRRTKGWVFLNDRRNSNKFLDLVSNAISKGAKVEIEPLARRGHNDSDFGEGSDESYDEGTPSRNEEADYSTNKVGFGASTWRPQGN